MDLTIEIANETGVRLVGRSALFAGDVYDVTLVFPQDAVPSVLPSVDVELWGPGGTVLAAASRLSPVPGHRRAFSCVLNMNTAALEALWESVAHSDSDGPFSVYFPETAPAVLRIHEPGRIYVQAPVPVVLRMLDPVAYVSEGSVTGMTSAERAKLRGVADGAEANVQADWSESDPLSDAYIRNKPPVASPGYVDGLARELASRISGLAASKFDVSDADALASRVNGLGSGLSDLGEALALKMDVSDAERELALKMDVSDAEAALALKMDVSDAEAALALKMDVSDAERELALKMDVSDAEVALADRPDRDEVASGFSGWTVVPSEAGGRILSVARVGGEWHLLADGTSVGSPAAGPADAVVLDFTVVSSGSPVSVHASRLRYAPTRVSQLPNDAGYLVDGDLDPVRSRLATLERQPEYAKARADWSESDESAADFIMNKPDVAGMIRAAVSPLESDSDPLVRMARAARAAPPWRTVLVPQRFFLGAEGVDGMLNVFMSRMAHWSRLEAYGANDLFGLWIRRDPGLERNDPQGRIWWQGRWTVPGSADGDPHYGMSDSDSDGGYVLALRIALSWDPSEAQGGLQAYVDMWYGGEGSDSDEVPLAPDPSGLGDDPEDGHPFQIGVAEGDEIDAGGFSAQVRWLADQSAETASAELVRDSQYVWRLAPSTSVSADFCSYALLMDKRDLALVDQYRYGDVRSYPAVYMDDLERLVGGAPETLDTLRELADLLAGSDSDGPASVLSRIADLEGRTADSVLSATSENPVQNKVVTEAVNARPTKTQIDAGWWSEWTFTGNVAEGVVYSVFEVDTGIGNVYSYMLRGDGVSIDSADTVGESSSVDFTNEGITATRHRVAAPVPTTTSDLTNDGSDGVHPFLTSHQTWSEVKPSGGIPATDLASAVQTSLGLADTAVQPSGITEKMPMYPFATPTFAQTGGWTFSGTAASTGKHWEVEWDVDASRWYLYEVANGAARTDADKVGKIMNVDMDGSETSLSGFISVEDDSDILVTATRGYVCTLSPFTSSQIEMGWTFDISGDGLEASSLTYSSGTWTLVLTSGDAQGTLTAEGQEDAMMLVFSGEFVAIPITVTATRPPSEFEIAVGALPTGVTGKTRDCILVIGCSVEGRVAPTVTWGTHFHPRTDTATDLAIVEAGKRAVFYISEYAPGEFAVGGWQVTEGGYTPNGGGE